MVGAAAGRSFAGEGARNSEAVEVRSYWAEGKDCVVDHPRNLDRERKTWLRRSRRERVGALFRGAAIGLLVAKGGCYGR